MFGRKKKKEQLEAQQAATSPAGGKAAGERPADRASVGNFKPRNDKVTVRIEQTKRFYVNTAMATHIGTREYQQDAAYVCEPLYESGVAFGILCDGMGGMAGGEAASSEAAAFMANRIASLAEGQEIPAFLEQAAIDAGEMVSARNAESGESSGTTLVAALIRDGGLYWLSVGDSRIYILREGEIARLTRDHNFGLELQEMVEAGRITQEEADEDPRKDALVSYIGAPVLELVDVNRGAFPLRHGDIILLCSDGLTKVLPDAEILAAIREHGRDISEAARSLPLLAFDESPGGMDNTSVILMQYLGGNG